MGKDTDLVVVRTATTPAEAKILAALLQAEGVAAFVDGDALADEIAISRRAMNLAGVHVRVGRRDLEAAKEILAAAAVDEAELTAQALAAGPSPSPTAPARSERNGSSALPWLLAGVGAIGTLTFLALWRAEVEADHGGPLFRFRPVADGLEVVRRATGTVRDHLVDRDGDGIYERLDHRRRDGTAATIAIDDDRDGDYETVEVAFADGSKAVFRDLDGDFAYDTLTATGGDGIEHRQRWQNGRGFVDDR